MKMPLRRELADRLIQVSPCLMPATSTLWALRRGINPPNSHLQPFGSSENLFASSWVSPTSGSSARFPSVFLLKVRLRFIFFALLHERMPCARVYHAHTTGYAALIAAAVACDHGTSFLLTEHNPYILRHHHTKFLEATWRSRLPPTTLSPLRSVSTWAWAPSPFDERA